MSVILVQVKASSNVTVESTGFQSKALQSNFGRRAFCFQTHLRGVLMSEAIFKQFLGKARDAQKGGADAWHCQSTGEKLAVALVLNRADWLQMMDYTIAEAIDRVGPEWLSKILQVQRQLESDRFEDVPY